MFSQVEREAAKSEVALDDLEMVLRMTYDLSDKFPIKDFSATAQGIQYVFQISSESPLEQRRLVDPRRSIRLPEYERNSN